MPSTTLARSKSAYLWLWGLPESMKYKEDSVGVEEGEQKYDQVHHRADDREETHQLEAQDSE